MSEADQFDQCLALAQDIVGRYRAEAPPGCDPRNSMAVSAGFMIASAAVSVTGSVMSARAQRKQGKMADAMAQYNAHHETLNATMQYMVAQAQIKLQKKVAEAQFRLRQGEAEAFFANATHIRRTAEAQSRVAREAIRRKGGEYQRFQSAQRVMIAKSGFVESSGTPLDILAETAAQIQMEREDSLYADELNRRSLFREADLEQLGGKMALAGATLERSSSLATAALQGAAAKVALSRGMHDAEITRLTGGMQRQSYNDAAQATLFKGVADGMGTVGSAYFKSKSYSAATMPKAKT